MNIQYPVPQNRVFTTSVYTTYSNDPRYKSGYNLHYEYDRGAKLIKETVKQKKISSCWDIYLVPPSGGVPEYLCSYKREGWHKKFPCVGGPLAKKMEVAPLATDYIMCCTYRGRKKKTFLLFEQDLI